MSRKARPQAVMGCALACLAASVTGAGGGTEAQSPARISAARAGASDISRYSPGYGGIVFTEIPAPRVAEARAASGLTPAPLGEGGRLVLLNKDGSTRILTPDFESAADPAVSFDGKRILFAARRTTADHWDIFEMAAGGTGVHQVTRNAGNCRTPTYQSALFYLNDDRPSYQVTFASDLAGEIDESGPGIKMDLYSARFDGSGLRRLTYCLSASYDPFQMQDGRILFSSRQRRQAAETAPLDLFAVHLDGTDYAGFSGTQGRRIKRMACVTAKGEVVFVESDRPAWDGAGNIAAISMRRNLHSYRAITTPASGYFLSPSPLPDGSILVSRRATAGGTHSIYRLDPKTGARVRVYGRPGYHSMQAVALARRAEPDGHSSVVEDNQHWSKLYCLSVYENDLKREWMPEGTARRIRVIEAVPGKPKGTIAKRLLGDLELDEDGSFHLMVPPNTPIQLQIEDSDGAALRTSAWIWAKNKENRGCIGCHEDSERTPENVFPLALSHPAADLMLPPDRRRTVDFRRDVVPILTAKCSGAACHGSSMQPAFVATDPGRSYEALANPARGARYVDPGRARTSRLVWAILGRNISRPWDRVGSAPAIRPMPPRGSPPLTGLERRAIIEWIDLGAQFDALRPGGMAPGTSASGGRR